METQQEPTSNQINQQPIPNSQMDYSQDVGQNIASPDLHHPPASKHNKKFIVTMLCLGILVILLIYVGWREYKLYFSPGVEQQKDQETIVPQMVDEETGWKVFENDAVKFSYPPEGIDDGSQIIFPEIGIGLYVTDKRGSFYTECMDDMEVISQGNFVIRQFKRHQPTPEDMACTASDPQTLAEREYWVVQTADSYGPGLNFTHNLGDSPEAIEFIRQIADTLEFKDPDLEYQDWQVTQDDLLGLSIKHPADAQVSTANDQSMMISIRGNDSEPDDELIGVYELSIQKIGEIGNQSFDEIAQEYYDLYRNQSTSVGEMHKSEASPIVLDNPFNGKDYYVFFDLTDSENEFLSLGIYSNDNDVYVKRIYVLSGNLQHREKLLNLISDMNGFIVLE